MTLYADFNPNITVPFYRNRQLLLDSGGGLQAGVVGATDFKVAQRGAGANMSVDVPAGRAWVSATASGTTGLAHCVNDATANVTVTASNATNPRIDQILLRYNDSSIPTGAGDVPTLEVATGTATAGATLDNRTGAATPTGSFVRLADILVPAASTSVVTANIRDRRPWARGALFSQIGNGAGSYSTASTSLVAVASGAYDFRIECTGVPMELVIQGSVSNSIAGSGTTLALLSNAGEWGRVSATSATANARLPVHLRRILVPSVGSNLVSAQIAAVVSGTASLINLTAADTFTISACELIRPNSTN